MEKVHYDDGVPYYTVKFAANAQRPDARHDFRAFVHVIASYMYILYEKHLYDIPVT